MISTWTVLFACVVGALSAEYESIGKLPFRSSNKPHPSLDIFNGKNTSISKYPYMVALNQFKYVFGAAVILNNRWLLSTGWTLGWVNATDLQFRVGSDYWNQGGQVLGAKKVILHPNYTGSWDWDIGLVKTDKEIVFGKNVKPIKLGTKTLKSDTKASVAGWGEYDESGNPSSTLLEAKVTVYDWKKCQTTYSKLTQRLMCSFDKKVAPCMYDFGDPLVVKGKVYGLFAGGFGCAPNVNPVLYTDVPSLYKWVQSTIKNNQDDDDDDFYDEE